MLQILNTIQYLPPILLSTVRVKFIRRKSGNENIKNEYCQVIYYDKDEVNKSKYKKDNKQKENKSEQKKIVSKNIEQIASKQTKTPSKLPYLENSYLNNLQ